MEVLINGNHTIKVLSEAEQLKLVAHKKSMLQAAEVGLQRGMGNVEVMIFVDAAVQSVRALGETDFSFAADYTTNAIPIALVNLERDVSLYGTIRADSLLKTIRHTQGRLSAWAEISGIDINDQLTSIQANLQRILTPLPFWQRLISRLPLFPKTLG